MMLAFIKRNKYPLTLLLIMLLGLWLRLRLSEDHYLHQWDERFHALVAKNLLKHPLKPTLYEDPCVKYDYSIWFRAHVWLHKQPVPLWLIAFSYKLFGFDEFITRLPSLLFSLLAIFVTYLLGKHLFNKRIGLLSAFFMAVNGLVIELGAGRVATDHYDLLFMAFIEIAILLAYYNAALQKKRYAFLSGLFIGIAVLTKWLPCLIVLIIHYCFLKDKKWRTAEAIKQLCWSLLPALVIALPWQIYILHQFPVESRTEYDHNWRHITQELEGQGAGVFYFIEQIRINYSEIIYLPLIYLVYRVIKTRFLDHKLLAIFLWILIPIIFFSIAKTKMQGYILFVCPAFFIITADFFFLLKDTWIRTMQKKWIRVLSYLLLVAMIVLPLRYCFERTSFGLQAPGYREYIETYKSFRNQFPERSVVLNISEPIEFMYYNNNCSAYPIDALSNEEKNSLIQKGYTIFTFDQHTRAINRVIN